MTNKFDYKQTGLVLACTLALSILSGTASAQLNTAEQSNYVSDTRGPIVMSGTGLCWHSGTGPAPVATVECGGTPAPVAQYVAPVAAPAPVYVAPAPAPVVAAYTPPPAPKPVAEKITLDADMLFDFDKSSLRPAGRDALDDFLGKLKDVSPETVMAIGHADRIGSERYNQNLSEQRVESVKSYLVSKGLESNRVSTSGKGESQPVTKAGECTGGSHAKTIACLQPDRRVEIEIIGTRINR
jgi:OOP family OmpA-OmpF porin